MKRREFLIQVATGVGWAVLGSAASAVPPQRVKVHGRVWQGTTRVPMAGIAISNGFEFAISDSAGAYALDVDIASYPFLFVNPPAGFRPRATHYRRLADLGNIGSVDFELELDAIRLGSRVRFAHISDSHIGVAAKPNFASDLDLAADYQAIVRDGTPDLILNGGDVTDAGRSEDFSASLEAAKSVPIPVFTAFGNHDADADREDFKGKTELTNNLRYQAVMGPDQYSFDWGDYHFIVCGMFWPGMSFRQPRMSAWFKADLARQPSYRKIVLLTHDKPRAFPELTETWAPTLGEFQRHPGALVALHGHHHTTCIFRQDKLTVVGVPTVCFGGIDTSPRGYALITLEDGRANVELRQLGRISRPHPKKARPPDLPVATINWQVQLPTNLHRAAPLVTGERILLSLGDNRPLQHMGVVALDRFSGREIWKYRTDSTVKNTVGFARPAEAGLRGSGFAVEVTGRLHRIDLATGERQWAVDLPFFPDRYIYATPRVTAAGIYVTQHQGSYAFAPENGQLLWRTGVHWDENRSSVYQCPAMDDTKLFFLTTTFMGRHAISAQQRSSGAILWTQRLDRLPAGYPDRFFQSYFPSPVIAGNMVVVPGLGDRLAVIDKETGEILWHEAVLTHDGPLTGARPAWYTVLYEHAHGMVVHDETIYATTSNGCVHAIDLRSGRRLWNFQSARTPLLDFHPYHRGRGNLLTEPAVSGSRLLVGGADGWLYVLNRMTGVLLAEVDFGSPLTASPAVSGDELVLTTFDGQCLSYRLDPTAKSYLADSENQDKRGVGLWLE